MDENRKRIALTFLLGILKQQSGAYGYDIWLSSSETLEHTLLWRCAVEILKVEPPPPYVPPTGRMEYRLGYGEPARETTLAREIYPLACDILWLLSRQGILRPGVREADGQSVSQGQGYSLTLRGREWVKSHSEDDLQALLAAL